MDFWSKIENLMEYKNISRKELAAKANFSYSSFTNGIKRNSIPAADVALRIAKVLGTTVEELFDEKAEITSESKKALQLVQTYSKLSERDKSVIENLANFMNKN